MISKKERRIQKALGLEDDMPLTIYKRMQYWWWRVTYYIKYRLTSDRFWQWLAFKLPKNLVYHSTIRAWAHATTCPSGRGENVWDTTVDNALKRWEKE